MTQPDATSRNIFGQRAGFYVNSASHTDAQTLAKLVELAKPEPYWLALDIATGTGHAAFAIAPKVKAITGLDITPEMLAEARILRRQRQLTNVNFCLGDVLHLPFADASLDLVICRRAAHHFLNINQSLAEMARVLRPRGRLVIDDRSVPENDFVAGCMNKLDWYHDGSHVCEYRPSQWQRLLAQTGLVLEQLEGYTRHRPLGSLTDNVAADRVNSIYALLNSLNQEQKQLLNLINKEGTLWINHWFVILSAQKE